LLRARKAKGEKRGEETEFFKRMVRRRRNKEKGRVHHNLAKMKKEKNDRFNNGTKKERTRSIPENGAAGQEENPYRGNATTVKSRDRKKCRISSKKPKRREGETDLWGKIDTQRGGPKKKGETICAKKK